MLPQRITRLVVCILTGCFMAAPSFAQSELAELIQAERREAALALIESGFDVDATHRDAVDPDLVEHLRELWLAGELRHLVDDEERRDLASCRRKRLDLGPNGGEQRTPCPPVHVEAAADSVRNLLVVSGSP